ncbi:hypothetical protein ABTZ78_00040 [Streptomyces bauhiniae]|uniref:hypothetical protein n=1 Tax=Streptomyces bauhiniae TaxID=2340725 RepID=UPI00332DEDC5
MNGSTRDRFRALVPAVTPPAVARFMAGQGWELENRREGVREIWRYPSDESSGYRYRVMLPLAEDYEDYEERFGDTLIALGRIYNLDPWGLLGIIADPGVDLISVHLNKGDEDSTVSFTQAKAFTDGFYGMLENAAIRARNPNSSGGGRRAKQVTRYMSDNVHFLRFTSEKALSLMVVSHLHSDRLKVVPADTGGTPYPRQVVRTLMDDLSSMQTTSGSLQSELPMPSNLRREAAHAASTKCLVTMINSLDIRSVDFSFQLAAGYEDIGDRDVALSFERDALKHIADFEKAFSGNRRRLLTENLDTAISRSPGITSPKEKEELTFTGLVQGVFRNSGDITNVRAGGVMMMSADLGEDEGTVHVRLNEDEYMYAIEAHRRNIPVTVRGSLARAGNVVELYGESIIDIDELRRSLD